MPTTTVECVACTTIATGPTVTITEYASAEICRFLDQKGRSWCWYMLMIPISFLLCPLMNLYFSVKVPGTKDAKMGIERLCEWMASRSWRRGTKEQQVSRDRKVLNGNGNTMKLGC